MAGSLVGEVMTAAPALRARGVSQRGIVAAIVVAEGCREHSRTGHVSRKRVAMVLGTSERTASRALAELQDLDVITLVERGQRTAPTDGGPARGVAARYRLHLLPGPQDTQVSPGHDEPQDTQVSPGSPGNYGNQETDPARPGDRSGPTTGHPGVALPVAPVVPVAAAAADESVEPGRDARWLASRLGVSDDDGARLLRSVVETAKRPVENVRGYLRSIPDDDLRGRLVDLRRSAEGWDDGWSSELAEGRRRAETEALTVECPSCEAQRGEPCIDPNTGSPRPIHAPRRRVAEKRAAS